MGLVTRSRSVADPPDAAGTAEAKEGDDLMASTQEAVARREHVVSRQHDGAEEETRVRIGVVGLGYWGAQPGSSPQRVGHGRARLDVRFAPRAARRPRAALPGCSSHAG